MNSRIKIGLCFFLAGCFTFPAWAQKEKKDYSHEVIWGINKNTSGWLIGGVMFKKSVRGKGGAFRTYGLEIVNVRHPQETRVRAQTGNFFIYGKTNYLYALRLQYGRDWVLFRKANRSGVEIKGVLAAGPSIGIVAPYYVQWQSSFREVEHGQYDPTNPFHSYSRIIGPGFLLEGITESSIQLGGNLKIGLSFELGTTPRGVAGFEIGFLLDAYIDEVKMLPETENKAIFPTLYINLFYGSRK